MDFKKIKYESSVIPRDTRIFFEKTGNIYEAVVIIANRANQINMELKEELSSKLEEFASSYDNLEEVFENKEQIEVSKFYERIAKPTIIAINEFIEDKLEIRRINDNSENTISSLKIKKS